MNLTNILLGLIVFLLCVLAGEAWQISAQPQITNVYIAEMHASTATWNDVGCPTEPPQ